MPQISVIVPVYKVEPYLRRCVDSILNQTFVDFELILVDDGSPDNCGAICDEYAKQDSRVVVIHQENGGLSAARNAGIDWAFANSDSEWIAFVDSDDWIHPEYLKVLLNIALQYGVKCSLCEAKRVRDWQQYSDYEGIGRKFSSEVAYSEHYEITIVAWAKLFRKELFAETRFPVKKLHEDAFIIYKVLLKAGYVSICWDPLYYYFQNPNGIMNSCWTPNRLDEIEAHECQISYLKANKYFKGLEREHRAFLRVLARHIVATSSQKKYSRYTQQLRRKLKRALLVYKMRHEYPVCGNEWVYEAAFPKTMNLYWLIKAIQKKLP